MPLAEGFAGADLDRLFDRQLLLVSGKGGVGKTMIAASLALAAARRGKRVLLAQFKSNVDAGLLFGPEPVGEAVVEVRPDLSITNMTPQAALREYGMMIFRFRAIYRAVFDNKLMRSFLGAMPGLDDYSMLGKIWFHSTEELGGRPRFDLIVFDGPATGHLLKVLSVPRLILQAVPDSLLTRDAQKLQEMLTNPQRTAAVIVTLAEELPTAEALELYGALSGRMGIQVAQLVVNCVYPRVACTEVSLTDPSWDAVAGPVSLVLDAARIFRGRRRINDRYLAALRQQIAAPGIALPLLFGDGFGAAEIGYLADLLAGGALGDDPHRPPAEGPI